ncbi:hypothetical protein B0O99DRAFT_2319 [Bisporella sp. PMI_857]|nr:hypothetical protein B0O99DRAFT_2319 [Bisporella sp. PMI_857]
MERLQVRQSEFTSIKTKAVEDAKKMQTTVLEICKKAGKDPPKYVLKELIGKGSFGRVYKGRDMATGDTVAVKIIDIDESDTINPRQANSYSEFLKEVNALKLLSESRARNINHVIEALPVGQAMWMITEYCGGGSIATLMKPTAPGGLQEKWIIPILREVAEALKWVHQAGIIHRDIKCANVLITEKGDVQLCDFGVAGIIETKIDKRSTVVGTPHWMAPELFTNTPSYGKEIDIWAFGSMVFEIATGLPPNVAKGIISYDALKSNLKNHVPRLEGGNYSGNLRNLVAFCLEEQPSARPTIEDVQQHPYIYRSSEQYPTESLVHLVRAFSVWEDRGGSRKSLFMAGGAQGPSSDNSFPQPDDEWNFSTTAKFDQGFSKEGSVQELYEAYGSAVELSNGYSQELPRQSKPQVQKSSRRRPPPEALSRLPTQPLEKIFDPNTLSNYEDNSRNQYGGRNMAQSSTSDLPLRDDSTQTSIKDTMIDLGGHDSDTGLSSFHNMDTIRAGDHIQQTSNIGNGSAFQDFSRPAHSDPADAKDNRRTQDWKFPSMAPPASADPELSRFPGIFELPRPTVTPGSGGRPKLTHHTTEPVPQFSNLAISTTAENDRSSLINLDLASEPAVPAIAAITAVAERSSLIDLDMGGLDMDGLIDMDEAYNAEDFGRPSTASSAVSDAATSASNNPFELERHASLYQPHPTSNHREPSIYISSDFTPLPGIQSDHLQGASSSAIIGESATSVADTQSSKLRIQDHIGMKATSTFSEVQYDISEIDGYSSTANTSEAENTGYSTGDNGGTDGVSDSELLTMGPPPRTNGTSSQRPAERVYTIADGPPLVGPPSQRVMSGAASSEEIKAEMERMLESFEEQLAWHNLLRQSPQVRDQIVPARKKKIKKKSSNQVGQADIKDPKEKDDGGSATKISATAA